MSRERVLEKLRKLESLARSSNAHEADTAKKLADLLKKNHQITDNEIGEFEKDQPVELPVGEGFEDLWKFMLLSAAAEFHSCEAIMLKLGDRHKARIIGSDLNTKESFGLFNSLMDELTKVEKSVSSNLEDFAETLGSDPYCLKISPDDLSYSVRFGIADRLIEELRELNSTKKRSEAPVVVTGLEVAIRDKKKSKKKATSSYKPITAKEKRTTSETWRSIGYEIAKIRNCKGLEDFFFMNE